MHRNVLGNCQDETGDTFHEGLDNSHSELDRDIMVLFRKSVTKETTIYEKPHHWDLTNAEWSKIDAATNITRCPTTGCNSTRGPQLDAEIGGCTERYFCTVLQNCGQTVRTPPVHEAVPERYSCLHPVAHLETCKTKDARQHHVRRVAFMNESNALVFERLTCLNDAAQSRTVFL